MDTIDLACELKQDYVSFAIAIPFPGTELYEKLDEFGGKILVDPAPDVLEPRARIQGLDVGDHYVPHPHPVEWIALVGAVSVLQEAGYSFPRVAGTSAGSTSRLMMKRLISRIANGSS